MTNSRRSLINKISKPTAIKQEEREEGSKFGGDRILKISVDDIVPHEKQARIFVEDASFHNLVESIKREGQNITPIKVKPERCIETRKIRYQVLSGERRWRACKKAGVKNIRAISVDDDKAALRLSVDENELRQDLHPINRGVQFKELKESGDQNFNTNVKIGEAYGLKESVVAEYIRYSRVPKKVRERIVKEDIRSRRFLRSLNTKIRDIERRYDSRDVDREVIESEIENAALILISDLNKKITRKRKKAIISVKIDENTNELEIESGMLDNDQLNKLNTLITDFLEKELR